MWVESVAGEGSTFHFTITADAAEVPSRVAAAGLPSELIGKRVLLVDDNAINRRILDLQTEAWGIHGHSVETGEACRSNGAGAAMTSRSASASPSATPPAARSASRAAPNTPRSAPS